MKECPRCGQRLVTWRRYFWSVLLMLFVGAFTYSIIADKFIYHSRTYDDPIIEGVGLSERELGYVAYLVYSIKPEYRETIRKIVFYKDQPSMAKDYGNENLSLPGKIGGKYLVGFNMASGFKIVVWLDDFELRETICHEILHSIIQTKNEEWFVDDLESDFCFKENRGNDEF